MKKETYIALKNAWSKEASARTPATLLSTIFYLLLLKEPEDAIKGFTPITNPKKLLGYFYFGNDMHTKNPMKNLLSDTKNILNYFRPFNDTYYNSYNAYKESMTKSYFSKGINKALLDIIEKDETFDIKAFAGKVDKFLSILVSSNPK